MTSQDGTSTYGYDKESIGTVGIGPYLVIGQRR